MTLALRGTLRAGVARVSTRNGFVLIVMFLVATLLQTGLIWLVSTTYLPLGSGTPMIPAPRTGPTLGTSPSALVISASVFLVSITGGVLTVPIQIIAIRTMVSSYTDRIPEEFVFHNMGWASLRTLLGSFLVAFLVVILGLGCVLPIFMLLFDMMDPLTRLWLVGHQWGWAAIGLLAFVLLLPTIYLNAILLFVSYEISIKDRGLIEAIAGSWRCCHGNSLRLLALVLLSYFLPSTVSYAFNYYIPHHTEFNVIILSSLSFVLLTIVQIVMLAIIARAYVAVNDETMTIVASESQLFGQRDRNTIE